MKKLALPWLVALAVTGLAILARTFVIQPPEVAHQCDGVGAGPWWCLARSAIIMTYSRYGLGYAALVLSILCLLRRGVVISCAALSVGGAGLVLYCYEPGAVAFAVGALVLARRQHQILMGRPRLA